MTIAPSFAEIDVSGADARAFLHGQFASDVQALDVGQWQYSCYCVADGRVQALMMIARSSEQEFRLILPADLAAGVAERLTRFRLRARCAIALRALAIAAPPAAAAAPAVDDDSAADVHSYSCDAFAWRVTAVAESVPLPADLWAQQIALGIPWIVAATSASFLPQMLALERLRALSLRKGCFPGQEVVARTHFLGRVKRRLVALTAVDASAALAPGAALTSVDSGDPAGTMLALGNDGSALAVVGEMVAVGARLRADAADPCATFVIDRDVNGTISDTLLNGRCTPHSAHGVSPTKMV